MCAPCPSQKSTDYAGYCQLFDAIAAGLLTSNETLSPRLSWNTKIASVIPDWDMADPIAASESTIIDLLSHRTGIPRHDFAYYGTQCVSSLVCYLCQYFSLALTLKIMVNIDIKYQISSSFIWISRDIAV